MQEELLPNLIGSGVRADVELAGSRARIVHSTQHLLTAHQHLDLLPGWHALPTLCFIQSLTDEWRIVVHFRLRTLALGSEGNVRVGCLLLQPLKIMSKLTFHHLKENLSSLMPLTVSQCYDVIKNFATSFWFNSLLSLGWQRKKVNEAKHDECSHFGWQRLKRPDIPQSLDEKGNGKENMFYFGQYLKQEKVFPLLWTRVTQNFFPVEPPPRRMQMHVCR